MTGRDFPTARAVAHESSGRSAGGVRTALGAAVRGGVHSSHQTRAAPQRGVLSSGAGRCAVKLPERPPLDLPCHSLVSSMFGVTAVCQAQGLAGRDQETCPVELCPGEVERSGG